MNHFIVLFLRLWFYYNTFSFSFLPPNHLIYPSHCLSNYGLFFFSLIIIYGRNSWPKMVWKDWSDICQEKLMSTMWWISEELKLVLSWHANRSWMKRPRQKRKDLWKQFMWRLLPTFILQVNGGLQHRNIEINSLAMFLLIFF